MINTDIRVYLLRFGLWSVILFCILMLVVHFLSLGKLLTFSLGYLLSFVFAGSNFWNLRNVKIRNHQLFRRLFYRNLAGRLIFILAAIIVVLLAKSQGRIFFIISFMFSYICLSAIEVLTIRKILKTNRKD